MGATLTTIDGILKTKYLGTVNEALTNGRVLLEKLARNTEDYDGQKVRLSINKSRNSGLGAAAENGTLPTAGNQGYVNADFTLKYVYGRLQLTGQTMDLSRTNAGAFARALDREMKGLVRDLKNDVNRIFNGDGTGTLTTTTTTATGTVKVVGSTRFLNAGDTIMFGAATQATIASVDSDTQITTDSVATTSGDTIKRRIGSSIVAEPDGIALGIASTGTFGTIARTGNTFWQSTVLGNTGVNRPITLALMDALTRAVEKRTNELPDAFYAKHELRDAYGQVLQADQRYIGTASSDTDGGKKVLSHKDVPFLVDFHATDNVVYAPKWDNYQIAESGPIKWMDEDGAVLSRVANLDAYEATLRYYVQFIASNCRDSAKLTDVTEAA